MGDDISYFDLLILKKLDPDSTVEKFGMKINTSFFDAANLIGSMKIKGLVDISPSIGGQSPIIITGEGRDLVSAAIQKAGEPIDSLDQTILNALVSGVRDLAALQKVINIRSKDLAFRLYKLKAYDYIDQTVQSARVEFSLTEKGFLLTKGYRSSIKASEAAKPILTQSEETSPTAPAVSSQTVAKKSSSIEDEIRELFNFKSSAEKKDGRKELPKPSKPALTPSKPILAPSSGQVRDEKSSSPNISSASSATKDSTKNISPSPTLTSRLPPFMQKSPPQKQGKLDRQAMLLSKIEFYVQKYAVFALMLLIMLALVAFALILVFFS